MAPVLKTGDPKGSVGSNPTPSVSVTASKGALTYRGAIDPTTTEPPADAALGDVYLASTGGMALESCSGVAG